MILDISYCVVVSPINAVWQAADEQRLLGIVDLDVLWFEAQESLAVFFVGKISELVHSHWKFGIGRGRGAEIFRINGLIYKTI